VGSTRTFAFAQNRVVRILVATDRTETAARAVEWAAAMAERYDAELLLLQVLLPDGDGDEPPAVEASLRELAETIAGARGRARVHVHADPSRAIVEAAEEEGADVLVLGNAGMGGRKEFLLGNVPNRVSHTARCTVVIVNTGAAVPSGPPADEEPDVEGRLLGRAGKIGRVLSKFGLEARGGSNEARARAMRDALEELGPTFAKLGQILSTRPDLLPAGFAEELAQLQDKVAPLTEHEVVAVMEQELGVPWEDIFASIDPVPLAAGTIGQVHRATLESGERVVVKVQRPSAREEIMRDLGLLELFAEKALRRPGLRGAVDIPALVEHLSASLRRELDFREEAANMERMREVLAPYDRLDVPRLHADLSTARLLVMEEVLGGPIREAPEGEERREAARQLLESYYRQLLADGFFHADPHPGNLMWWDRKIYFLDLGMVGELPPELRELMIVLLLAFYRDDAKLLTEAMLLLSGEDARPDLDLGTMESDFAAYIGRFRGVALKDIRIGPMLEGLIEIATRQGVRLPSALALSGKAFGQMQLAVAELDPMLDPFDVVQGFLLRNVVERLRGHADPRRLLYEGQKLKLRFTRILEAIERVSGARPGQKLQVEFLGATEIEDAINLAGRRLALAVTAGAGFVGAGLAASDGAPRRVSRALGGTASVLAAWLALDLLRRR
jgi:predicted unusual protein kinase regulating ubiquinone biosynthesis (AarF/ABC1/UbiB family)/nucleotide-binding universal stress UspA family protein